MGDSDAVGELGSFFMSNQVTVTVFTIAHFADILSTLRTELTRRFADFEVQKFHFELFRNPFAIDVEKVSKNIQMERKELQCNGTLKSKYDFLGPAQFSCLLLK